MKVVKLSMCLGWLRLVINENIFQGDAFDSYFVEIYPVSLKKLWLLALILFHSFTSLYAPLIIEEEEATERIVEMVPHHCLCAVIPSSPALHVFHATLLLGSLWMATTTLVAFSNTLCEHL